MVNKEIEEILKRVENVCSAFKNCKEAKTAFEVLFENISDICENGDQKVFNLHKILKSKPLGVVVKKYLETETALLIDFLPWKNAKMGFVMVFNGFVGDNVLPDIMEIYQLKDEMIEKLFKND